MSSVFKVSYCTKRLGNILKNDSHVPQFEHVNELLFGGRFFSTLSGKQVLVNKDRRKPKLTDFIVLVLKKKNH